MDTPLIITVRHGAVDNIYGTQPGTPIYVIDYDVDGFTQDECVGDPPAVVVRFRDDDPEGDRVIAGDLSMRYITVAHSLNR